MMPILPSIFSLLCAAAGWYYLLHAQSAARLGGLENARELRLRVRLRRAGGIGILVISLAFYLSFVAVNRHGNPYVVLVGLSVIVLTLPAILFLAWVDLRLTRRMRDRKTDQQRDGR